MIQEPEGTAEIRFGAQVRAARDARAWTQEELRYRLLEDYEVDLSKTAMARLEKGGRPIRLNEVAALADLLHLDLSRYSGHVSPGLDDVDHYRRWYSAIRRLSESLIPDLEQRLADVQQRRRELVEEEIRLTRKVADFRLRNEVATEWLARLGEKAAGDN